jgi:hypothetical protein
VPQRCHLNKPKDSPDRSGRLPDGLKMKNPAREALKREAEEDWGDGDKALRLDWTERSRERNQ